MDAKKDGVKFHFLNLSKNPVYVCQAVVRTRQNEGFPAVD